MEPMFLKDVEEKKPEGAFAAIDPEPFARREPRPVAYRAMPPNPVVDMLFV